MAYKNYLSPNEWSFSEMRTPRDAPAVRPGYHRSVPSNIASTDIQNQRDSYEDSRRPHKSYQNESKIRHDDRFQQMLPLRHGREAQFPEAPGRAGRSQKPSFNEGRMHPSTDRSTNNAYMKDYSPITYEEDRSPYPYSNSGSRRPAGEYGKNERMRDIEIHREKRRANIQKDFSPSSRPQPLTKYMENYVPSHSRVPYPYGPAEDSAGMQQLSYDDRAFTASQPGHLERSRGQYISADRQTVTPVYPPFSERYTSTANTDASQPKSYLQGLNQSNSGQHYNYEGNNQRMAVATVQQPQTLYNSLERSEDKDRVSSTQTIGYIIVKRIVSACFIILDLVFDWMALTSFTTHMPYPFNSNNDPSRFTSSFGGILTTHSWFWAFCGLGTTYVIFQLINICGETLLECRKTDDASSTIVSTVLRGFQIRHGYIETLFSLLCVDLPQLILALYISIYIPFDAHLATIILLGFMVSMMKNYVRLVTCKHIYVPNCSGQAGDWSKITCDLIPMCTVFYIRPCGGAGNKPCIESQKYDLLSDCSCKPNGVLFGDIKTDPKWAKRTFLRLNVSYILLYVALFLIVILRREVPTINSAFDSYVMNVGSN